MTEEKITEYLNTKIDLDITKIKIPQVFGFNTRYVKEEYLKHKRKKINDYNYNTAKSTLICYTHNYEHINNFVYSFIYLADDNNYFSRVFTPMGEQIQIISKKVALIYKNKEKTLF